MCRDILDDKNIKLEMMNNINMAQKSEVIQQQQQQQQHQHQQQRLPEKVMEMYNMLLGITTELEKIKYELAKRESYHQCIVFRKAIMLDHFRKQKLCSKPGRQN